MDSNVLFCLLYFVVYARVIVSEVLITILPNGFAENNTRRPE